MNFCSALEASWPADMAELTHARAEQSYKVQCFIQQMGTQIINSFAWHS